MKLLIDLASLKEQTSSENFEVFGTKITIGISNDR